MAYSLGKAFEGERDYYKVLGYDLYPQVDDFLGRYTRDDIAGKIVDLPPQDTWKKRPVLIDGEERSDGDQPRSEFIRAWQQLTDAGSDEALNVYHYFERIDRLSGIGRFGVLVIGARDGQTLDQPFQGRVIGPDGILYLRSCSEASVMISPTDIDMDPQSKRYGKPLWYQINIGGEMGQNGYQRVHYSRCIHVAEDLLEDEVYGRPRLERVLNRLDDIMKIVGGSAEATWKLMRKGFLLSAKEGYQQPTNSETRRDVDAQIEEYDHGLRRFIRLTGVDAQDLGSEVVDPSGLFGIVLSLIAAASGIPQRILIGSERGELASTQDLRSWANAIADRQSNFAEPSILRPFVNWCIRAGVLPPPKSGKYKVEWPKLYELTELEEAEAQEKRGEAFEQFAAGIVALLPLLDKIRSGQLPEGVGVELLLELGIEEDRARRIVAEMKKAKPPEPEPVKLPQLQPATVEPELTNGNGNGQPVMNGQGR
jgi:hypothetical protein